MNLLQRMHRFWQERPEPNHPLTEEERESVPPATVAEEVASIEESFVGAQFDPDENDRR